MSGQVGPGWYADGAGGERWWDGQQWTDQSRPAQPSAQPAGQQFGQLPGQPGQFGQQPGQPGPQPTKKRGLLIAVVAVVVVLVLVGGSLAAYFVFRDSDDDERGGGGGTSDSGPEAVAEEYAEAFALVDFAGMCELSSSDGRDELFEEFDDVTTCEEYDEAATAEYSDLLAEIDDVDQFDDFGEMREELRDNSTFVVDSSEVVDGDVETDGPLIVLVAATLQYSGEIPDIDPETEDEVALDMVREDDEWRVERINYDYEDGDDEPDDEGPLVPSPTSEPSASSEPSTSAAPEGSGGSPLASEEAAALLFQEIAVAAQANDWATICDVSSQGMQLYNFAFFDVDDCAGVADAAGTRNWAEVEVRSVDVPADAGEGDLATATLHHVSSAGAPGQFAMTLVVEAGEWHLDTDMIPS